MVLMRSVSTVNNWIIEYKIARACLRITSIILCKLSKKEQHIDVRCLLKLWLYLVLLSTCYFTVMYPAPSRGVICSVFDCKGRRFSFGMGVHTFLFLQLQCSLGATSILFQRFQSPTPTPSFNSTANLANLAYTLAFFTSPTALYARVAWPYGTSRNPSNPSSL